MTKPFIFCIPLEIYQFENAVIWYQVSYSYITSLRIVLPDDSVI